MFRYVAGWARGKLHRRGTSHELTLRLREVNLLIDTSRAELNSYWEIWHERMYDKVPGFCPVEPDCVVDVGANIGAFALYQACKKRAKAVIAFEPSPTVFKRLEANVALNGLRNITTVNAAVGDLCGSLPFLELPMSMNSRVAAGSELGATIVPATTLDSSLLKLGVARVNLLKIDTEGYETHVLRGATGILGLTERLIIEIHDETDKSEFQALLLPLGFQLICSDAGLLFYSR